MEINSDFSQRVVVTPDDQVWHPSPVKGVERLMFDRMGVETGHATSMVRYAPNVHFTPHMHSGGEEFLVLSGTFHDEHGDYPKGHYVRNPVGSSHTPWAGEHGTLIFVKLHQMDIQDQCRIAIDTHLARWVDGSSEGASILTLHNFGAEVTQLVRISPYQEYQIHHNSLSEILVLSGELSDESQIYRKESWIRNPPGYAQTFCTGDEDAVFYLKLSK